MAWCCRYLEHALLQRYGEASAGVEQAVLGDDAQPQHAARPAAAHHAHQGRHGLAFF